MPYLAHFGLKEHPFTLTPDVDYFFPTQEHANIIGSVEFALRRDTGIIKVVGPVGTGKTLLCRLLIKKLVDSEAVAYINAPRASANSIILNVCKEFGVEAGGDADAAYGALNRFLVEEHAKNRLAVLVVDEAQHLGKEGLELVRLISNLETEKRKLLQIVMFGQTELDELLADPSLRQLTQRIAFSLATKPLTVEETRNYINHRIRVSRREGIVYDVFTNRAIDFLAKSCGGIPRVINIIADKSLLAAFAAGSPVVQPAHIAEAIKESPALVRPVAPQQGLIRRWLSRAVTFLGGLFVVAVAAVVVLALVPAGNVSTGARGILRAVGVALTAPANTTAAQTPAPTTVTKDPAPAATPVAQPAATQAAQPAPAPSPSAAPTPPAVATPAVSPPASSVATQAKEPGATLPATEAKAPAAATVTPAAPPASATAATPASPAAPAAAAKPADGAAAVLTTTTTPAPPATVATTPAPATATSAPAATSTTAPTSADTVAQPSARAAMHKIKRPNKKPAPAAPAVQPKPDQATPGMAPATTQRADESPKASAAPRETVIVEHIATPESPVETKAGASSGMTRPSP